MLLRRRLLIPSSEPGGSIRRSIWATRPVVAVPRALCLHACFETRGVPWAALRGFVNLQLARLSPYDQTQSHVEVGPRFIRVWYWDKQRLGQLLGTSLSAADWTNHLFIPESQLLSGSSTGQADQLTRLALGGSMGVFKAASGQVREVFWPTHPSAAQWAEHTSSALPATRSAATRVAQAPWIKALRPSTLLGAAWWQSTPKSSGAKVPLAAVACLLGVAATAAFAGYHAMHWHQASQQQASMRQSLLAKRSAAAEQLQTLAGIQTAQDQSRGLAAYSGPSVAPEALACLALTLDGSGLTIREIDIRSTSLQATLNANEVVDIQDAQRVVERCSALIEPLVEPAGDPKAVRLNATLAARGKA
jgi:hypothetical protein